MLEKRLHNYCADEPVQVKFVHTQNLNFKIESIKET